MGRPRDARLDFRAEPAFLSGPQASARTQTPWVSGALLLGALTAGTVWAVRSSQGSPAPQGTLRIESDPSGAAVELAGALRGQTPLTLTLAPGTYAITIVHEGRRRTIDASVEQDGHTVHHIVLPRSPRLFGEGDRGRLQIGSDPPGATVTVDGTVRGLAPLSIEDLPPGEHEVVTQHLGVTQRRVVLVDAGSTSSLLIAASSDAQAGWLAVQSPVPLRIYEGGNLVGTSDSSRIQLPEGPHTLEFAADELGFRVRRTITISAGRVASATVDLPMATLHVNAEPWAEVWVDGRRIGETPIANLLQTIGTHRVMLRHPQLGEQQTTVTVSLKEPARVAVDMRVR